MKYHKAIRFFFCSNNRTCCKIKREEALLFSTPSHANMRLSRQYFLSCPTISIPPMRAMKRTWQHVTSVRQSDLPARPMTYLIDECRGRVL